MEQTTIQQGTKGPQKKFTTGSVSATVWQNTAQTPNGTAEFQTVQLQRTYKDKNGEWKNTSGLRTNDLPKAALVLQKAYEYIVLKGEAEAQ